MRAGSPHHTLGEAALAYRATPAETPTRCEVPMSSCPRLHCFTRKTTNKSSWAKFNEITFSTASIGFPLLRHRYQSLLTNNRYLCYVVYALLYCPDQVGQSHVPAACSARRYSGRFGEKAKAATVNWVFRVAPLAYLARIVQYQLRSSCMACPAEHPQTTAVLVDDCVYISP